MRGRYIPGIFLQHSWGPLFWGSLKTKPFKRLIFGLKNAQPGAAAAAAAVAPKLGAREVLLGGGRLNFLNPGN